MRTRGTCALGAYILSIVAANWLVRHYGLVHVGFGLTATAGTYAAGAALLLRDVVQHALGKAWVVGGIAVGAALTATTAPSLAAASATAFLLAELADMAVYTPLRKQVKKSEDRYYDRTVTTYGPRSPWWFALVVSNVVGGIIDTFVFLHLAGFPTTTSGVEGNFVGKLVWATALPVALVVGWRALLRKPIQG